MKDGKGQFYRKLKLEKKTKKLIQEYRKLVSRMKGELK